MLHLRFSFKSALLAVLLTLGSSVGSAGDDSRDQIVVVALVGAVVVAIVAITHRPDPFGYYDGRVWQGDTKPNETIGYYAALSPEKDLESYRFQTGIKVKF